MLAQMLQNVLRKCTPAVQNVHLWGSAEYTVQKNDAIFRAIERMLQTQLSMARKFQLWRLHRYSVKHFLKCVSLRSIRHGWKKLNNTGRARTNTL